MHVVIAHFGSHYVKNPGGVENVICRLANALVHQGMKSQSFIEMIKKGIPTFRLTKKWCRRIFCLKEAERLYRKNFLQDIEFSGSYPDCFLKQRRRKLM